MLLCVIGLVYSIRNENIISYKESFFEDSTRELCIVMEHADGGDLLKLINERKKIDPFNEN